ncbi:MAG: hypothetical protein ACTTH8_02370 [Treponema sp.]
MSLFENKQTTLYGLLAHYAAMIRNKPHKYKVASKERRSIDGITFDSMAEMNCLTVIAQIVRLQLNDEFAARQTSQNFLHFLMCIAKVLLFICFKC